MFASGCDVHDPKVLPPAELPAGVYELAGVSPVLPHTDLEPFRHIVGNARFVGLGECVHTSRGYYQAKARLIRFMVEEMGFRVIAFESPWLEGLSATRYVASCQGTPEAALAGLYRVWHDPSVLDLLRWLCEYNSTHPSDPVTFLGFDIQEPWTSVPALKQFVQQAAPNEIARTEMLDRCLGATDGTMRDFLLSQQYRDHAEGRQNMEAHQQCMSGISDMKSWLSTNASALEGATSATAVEEARIALIGLHAYEKQLWIPDPGGFQARDHGMAETLLRLHALHTPQQKTIVWAWNWHIARRYEEVRGYDDDPSDRVPRQGARAMGSFLHDALGSDYLPVALIGYHVRLTGGAPLPLPTNPLAVEQRLHDLGRDYLLVDLRQPLPDTLLVPGRTYKMSREWSDPYRQFGALIFLEHSPPMTYVNVGGP